MSVSFENTLKGTLNGLCFIILSKGRLFRRLLHCLDKIQVMMEYFLFQIAEEYDFVPRKLVEDYCSDCTVRTLKRAQHVTAPLQPILTSNFMERLQVIDNCDRTARALNISGATST